MKKAIDIVILPPKEIEEIAISLSAQLKGAKFIKLNQRTQLPHISLLMGGIEEEQIDEFWNNCLKILNSHEPFQVNINEVRVRAGYTGLHIENSSEIYGLHEALVEKLMPLMNYDCKVSDFAEPANTEEKSLQWVNGFPQNSTLTNFDPHITVGDGKLEELSGVGLPITFQAGRIALCHLGNYCTCSHILREVTLK